MGRGAHHVCGARLASAPQPARSKLATRHTDCSRLAGPLLPPAMEARRTAPHTHPCIQGSTSCMPCIQGSTSCMPCIQGSTSCMRGGPSRARRRGPTDEMKWPAYPRPLPSLCMPGEGHGAQICSRAPAQAGLQPAAVKHDTLQQCAQCTKAACRVAPPLTHRHREPQPALSRGTVPHTKAPRSSGPGADTEQPGQAAAVPAVAYRLHTQRCPSDAPCILLRMLCGWVMFGQLLRRLAVCPGKEGHNVCAWKACRESDIPMPFHQILVKPHHRHCHVAMLQPHQAASGCCGVQRSVHKRQHCCLPESNGKRGR